MITLTVVDTEAAIQAAFNRYLVQNSNSFYIQLGGNNVQVTIELRDHRFDCGTPGYNMQNADVPALKNWVSNNIRNGSDVGALAGCKDVSGTGQVNAYLLGDRSFNFHVWLTAPC